MKSTRQNHSYKNIKLFEAQKPISCSLKTLFAFLVYHAVMFNSLYSLPITSKNPPRRLADEASQNLEHVVTSFPVKVCRALFTKQINPQLIRSADVVCEVLL
jgi:hypothetical protein